MSTSKALLNGQYFRFDFKNKKVCPLKCAKGVASTFQKTLENLTFLPKLVYFTGIINRTKVLHVVVCHISNDLQNVHTLRGKKPPELSNYSIYRSLVVFHTLPDSERTRGTSSTSERSRG
jgi:hypothetical protein